MKIEKSDVEKWLKEQNYGFESRPNLIDIIADFTNSLIKERDTLIDLLELRHLIKPNVLKRKPIPLPIPIPLIMMSPCPECLANVPVAGYAICVL